MPTPLSQVFDVYRLLKEEDGSYTPVGQESYQDQAEALKAAQALGDALVLQTTSTVLVEFKDGKAHWRT